METLFLYLLAIGLLLFSFFRDRQKTKQSLARAWKSFANILPQMLGMISSIGVILALLNPALIGKIIGGSSGWYGVMLAAIIGSITLIPAFVAFPMAAILLANGAGYMQLASFVSTLTMVGLITLPLEIRFFGKKFAFIRNTLAFVLALGIALVIGLVFR